MKNLLIIIISLITISLNAIIAQSLGDAVRYSQFNPGGTARVLGVGGSYGAMGGDFSVININPAGLGEFKMSEFSITPSFNNTVAQAGFANILANRIIQRNTKLALDNAGLVFSKGNNSKLTTNNFAIGFSKTSDLNEIFTYSGKSKGSITQRFKERANGKAVKDLDPFEAGVAFDAGAIYDLNKDLNYEADVFENEALDKSQEVIRNGQINELSIAWAGKLDNKLNVGLAINVPFINFEENKNYVEEDKSNEVPFFDKLLFDEFLSTSGAGLNVKGGVIYNFTKFLRIGASFHSPTWYELNDNFSTAIDYTFTDKKRENYKANSPQGDFKYQLITPWRAIGSLGTIYDFGKVKGFINADVEYVDYKYNRFDLTEYSNAAGDRTYQNELNRDIQKFLSQSVNYRLGTELVISKLRFRAGVASTQTPFSADLSRNTSKSFGVGIRQDKIFIDAALFRSEQDSGYIPYALANPAKDPLVNVNMNRTRVLITVGMKF